MTTASEVVGFWREAGMQKWFRGGAEFDRECESRFLGAHLAAARREHEHWMDDAEGALALLILLDQIPRNVFRDSGHAFASDGLALHYANCAVEAGLDVQVDPALRTFMYLPFEHSEAMADQRRSVSLFRTLGDEGYLDYAVQHLEVIEKFGRFPHRNRALGRISTAEEHTWLEAGGGF
ncbi:DUF924 family protein [Luteimonas sp. MJ293]|uniref:DUF924 family protein n=1 Tax=Luteimonas sp. MJ146 TaxID=3129240 RepID=UPI0031BACAF5